MSAPARFAEVRFVELGSPEWAAIWRALKARGYVTPLDREGGPNHAGDCPACDDQTGECWQYMGTWGGLHGFRHRAYPPTGERISVSIPPHEVSL